VAELAVIMVGLTNICRWTWTFGACSVIIGGVGLVRRGMEASVIPVSRGGDGMTVLTVMVTRVESARSVLLTEIAAEGVGPLDCL
jgi:hypothetical protein